MLSSMLLAVASATDPKADASALLAKLSTREVLSLLTGEGWWPKSGYVGSTSPKTDLVPPLYMNDGPQGYRTGFTNGPPKGTSTQFPSGLAIGATWDPELAHAWGSAMGVEFAGKGAMVQLGPGLNVARIPRNGRTFEYISGEDGLLGGALGAAAIRGIQSRGVMANAKHWVLNNQEFLRMHVSDDASARVRHEIYYPPFEAAVRAGVASIMCSYNRLNSTYSCENDETLRVDLRERLGFDGFVVSDWGATHSSAKAANATLDLEMPGSDHYGAKLLADLEAGRVSEQILRGLALRQLTQLFRFGAFDNATYPPAKGHLANNVTCEAHRSLARSLAAAATTILKNSESLLPLDLEHRPNLTIAVSGTQARAHVITGGGGSGAVAPSRILGAADAIEATLARSGGSMSYVERDAKQAAAAAAAADIALVFVGVDSSEGVDRMTLGLGGAQDALVEAVAAANPKTVVVVTSPGAVLLPWADRVASLLMQWMPGQESGGAIADVLFGRTEPMGRLPLTLPNHDGEMEFGRAQYPGKGVLDFHATYLEGLLVGYRWYHAHRVTPRFPFGHGLGYTTFEYHGPLTIRKQPSDESSQNVSVRVGFKLTNAGKRQGAEVVQLYLTYPHTASEPPALLRAFAKHVVPAGGSVSVALTLDTRAFSVWDERVHAWSLVRGSFEVAVGASSSNVALRGTVVI